MGTAYRSDLMNRTHYLYRAYIGDRLAYVGLTVNPPGRFARHGVIKPWWRDVTRIDIEEIQSREDALDAEAEAIACEGPLYNVARPRRALA